VLLLTVTGGIDPTLTVPVTGMAGLVILTLAVPDTTTLPFTGTGLVFVFATFTLAVPETTTLPVTGTGFAVVLVMRTASTARAFGAAMSVRGPSRAAVSVDSVIVLFMVNSPS
jgi:hypothetical protein